MMHDPVPLDRTFSLKPKSDANSDEEDFRSFWGGQVETRWQDLDKEYRCVLLAEAGAGKSFEMEARAKYADELGSFAFFIRIEDIEDGFEDAFEVGNSGSFENWLNSQEEAWFFLDSVDEARLKNPRNFEKAIKRFAKRIKPASQRAHIYISSRPYVWRNFSDRQLIEQYLPFAKLKSEKTADRESGPEMTRAQESAEPGSALCVYQLDPLDEKAVRLFADHCGTPKVDRLISELQRKNLMSLAARPFDLEAIIAKWKDGQSLDGRLELMQYIVDLRLKEIDPDREQRQPLNLEKAKRGVRVLAAAVVLTGEAGVRVPDSTLPEKGLDAAAILGEEWQPAEVQALLERGIFNDVLYGMVRFRHREVRELLAAEWFDHQLKAGSSRQATETLFFREQYGHKVITPRLRPVLPWLILFDAEIRHRALEISPEVVVEDGDAACLPPAVRRCLLNDIVERIAKDEDSRSARDNDAIARIAQPDLSEDALRLIKAYRNNEDAIFFLGRLVWQGEMTGCVPALLDIAVDQTRGIYARIAAARAVMTCGERDQKNQLWSQLNTLAAVFPRHLLTEMVKGAGADLISVNLLLTTLDNLEPYERFKATGLERALHDFIDRLPMDAAIATQEPLVSMVCGLNDCLDREPYIERGECHVSETFAWLLGAAVHVVERLVSVQSKAALSPEALSIMLKVPAVQFRQGIDLGEYKDCLQKNVPMWKDLNDTLFWRNVEEARDGLKIRKFERLIDVWPVQWIGPLWSFDATRFEDVLEFIATRDFLDDKLVALSLAHRIFMKSDQSADWLRKLEQAVGGNPDLGKRLSELLKPVKSQSTLDMEKRQAQRDAEQKKATEEHARKRAEWVAHLKATPDVVRHPTGLIPEGFSHDQLWLLQELEGEGFHARRDAGADWKALIPEFGKEVARAYRDAAVSHWRNYTPGLLSEGQDTRSIPYELIFSMTGLEIEACEVDNFPSNLTEAEARHALRYLVWELNGFPSWFERVYAIYPKLTLNAVLTELHWELEHTQADQPLHYILHDLLYFSPWLHQDLAPRIIAWLERNEVPNASALRDCIHLLLRGDASNEIVSRLAQSKISSSTEKGQLAIWYALWVDVDAEQAVPAVERWLSRLSTEEGSNEAQQFITNLMGSRRLSNTRPSRGSFRNAKLLKALHVLMHRYIRVEDDIDRSGGGVYSPTLRDDAQDGREALFNQLSEIPGKETYVALMELVKDHPDSWRRSWIEKLAYRRAEQDADLERWSPQQVRDYDLSQMMTPVTHRQLFDLTVSRLTDLKAWVERGNDSPYKTWQKADGETEMRNLVAGWLNGQSSGRYTCAQENELANSQRPDIWMQAPKVSSPVPIELKLLDKGWTGPKLCERLRNQLAGDYLREETAGCGVMLLIWQGCSDQSHWKVNGQSVVLSELQAALKDYWNTIAKDCPNVTAIEVILIDLTVRDAKSAF